jgi:hypothetical protein
MSTPIGRGDLGDQATMPIPLDHLAADLDPGYQGLEGGQRHRAARDLLAAPQLGGVDTVQPDQLPCHDDGVAVDDLGGAVARRWQNDRDVDRGGCTASSGALRC